MECMGILNVVLSVVELLDEAGESVKSYETKGETTLWGAS
jgi:hypothetical protein